MSELTPQTEPDLAPAPAPRVRVPADHYASPPGDVRQLFPRWVPIGCGTASAVLLVVAFAAGAWIAHKGIGPIMDSLLESMQGELSGMYAKDVPPAARKELESSLTQLRDDVRAERLPVARLDPVMGALRRATADGKLDAGEVRELTDTFRRIDKPEAKAPAAPGHPPRG